MKLSLEHIFPADRRPAIWDVARNRLMDDLSPTRKLERLVGRSLDCGGLWDQLWASIWQNVHARRAR